MEMRIDGTRWGARRLAGVVVLCFLAFGAPVRTIGQGSSGLGELHAPPMYSSRRADIEIELVKPPVSSTGTVYRIILVDNARKEQLPNLQVIPAQRVFQFEDITSDIRPVYYLDDQCRLFVLSQANGDLFIRKYSPYVTYSPKFSTDMIASPEAWLAAVRNIDIYRKLPSGDALFGTELLGRLQTVSTDELVPNAVKTEQRAKLKQELVDLLNTRLSEWTASLDEIAPLSAGSHSIQEIWLAKDVRAMRAAIARGDAPSADYRDKLRYLNRLVLADLLGAANVVCQMPESPQPVWYKRILRPSAPSIEPYYVPAFQALYNAADECTLETTPDGKLLFMRNRVRLPVVVDALTGDLIEPPSVKGLKLADIVSREGSVYDGDIPFLSCRFAIRVVSRDAQNQSFSGLLYWLNRSKPNRIRGEYKDGKLSWREYRNIDGAEVPGALFTATEAESGSAKLRFTTPDPDIGVAKLELDGTLDIRPRTEETALAGLSGRPLQGQSWPDSPFAGKDFPEATGRTMVYPRYARFVLDLIEFGPFRITQEDAVPDGDRYVTERRSGTYELSRVYFAPALAAYLGEPLPTTGTWVMEVGRTEGNTMPSWMRWNLQGDFLKADAVAQNSPRIPSVLSYRNSVVPDRPKDDARWKLREDIYLRK